MRFEHAAIAGFSCLALVGLIGWPSAGLRAQASTPPKGLTGLGAPGGLAVADPRAVTFEEEFLKELNARRAAARDERAPLLHDARLRGFARNEARLVATGSPEAAKTSERLQAQGLAPFGHWYAYAFGPDVKKVLAELAKDAGTAAALVDEYARVGVGAFYAEADPPFFQVALLLVRDPDPLLGKPGLAPAQTDPVMQSAAGALKACYDAALKKDLNLAGDVIFQIVIGGEGDVADAKLLKRMNQLEFDTCALGVVKALKFPRPHKGKPVTLNHPMRFRPPQGDRRLGVLTVSEVQGAFSVASVDFKRCYDERNKAREKENSLAPKLRGKLTLAITVAADGSLKSLDVLHDEINDAPMQKCVLERAKQLRFPRPRGNGEFDLTYPLSFAPGEI